MLDKKTILQQGVSESVIYGYLVYKWSQTVLMKDCL